MVISGRHWRISAVAAAHQWSIVVIRGAGVVHRPRNNGHYWPTIGGTSTRLSNCVWVLALYWRIDNVTWRGRGALQTRICRIGVPDANQWCCQSQAMWLTVVYMGANVGNIGRRSYTSGGWQRLSLGPFRVIY